MPYQQLEMMFSPSPEHFDISKNSEDAKDEFTLTDKDISDKLDRIIELLEHLVNELK